MHVKPSRLGKRPEPVKKANACEAITCGKRPGACEKASACEAPRLRHLCVLQFQLENTQDTTSSHELPRGLRETKVNQPAARRGCSRNIIAINTMHTCFT